MSLASSVFILFILSIPVHFFPLMLLVFPVLLGVQSQNGDPSSAREKDVDQRLPTTLRLIAICLTEEAFALPVRF
jgi:hypothetical protein